MSRKSGFVVAFVLIVGLAAGVTSEAEPSTASSPTIKPAPSIKSFSPQDLKSFFNSDIKPLSFTDFNRGPPPTITREVSPVEPATATAATKPSTSTTQTQTPSFGPATSFTATTGSMTDNILQGIRDLRLTLSEMDEKLDRVVQKVAPTEVNHPSGMMRKGADIFRKILHIPTPSPAGQDNKKGQKRGYFMNRWKGSDDDNAEEFGESGIGLRGRFRG